jgi:hypothetical protein
VPTVPVMTDSMCGADLSSSYIERRLTGSAADSSAAPLSMTFDIRSSSDSVAFAGLYTYLLHRELCCFCLCSHAALRLFHQTCRSKSSNLACFSLTHQEPCILSRLCRVATVSSPCAQYVKTTCFLGRFSVRHSWPSSQLLTTSSCR